MPQTTEMKEKGKKRQRQRQRTPIAAASPFSVVVVVLGPTTAWSSSWSCKKVSPRSTTTVSAAPRQCA
jgi:hypothetical protein